MELMVRTGFQSSLKQKLWYSTDMFLFCMYVRVSALSMVNCFI
jgi:hypothetical protein